MDRQILLSSKNLSVGYADGTSHHTLFELLDLNLRQGELVCFMGSNGIGKSTLIRTLAGLQPSLNGEVYISSSDPNKSTSLKLSVVLTDKVSAMNMTVHELIVFGRYPYLDWNIRLHAEDLQLIERAIKLTNIQHLISRKLYELSDGQLQMAMIARALAQHTPIILLDEPTAHLDLNNRVEIMNLLRNIARNEGKAILVSTHELDLALQTADLIWLAGHDKKIMTGIPEDLVLNGSFDEVFKFKGFDLKTGRVFHENFRKISVSLNGNGYEYLWTKNALERTGYIITDSAELNLSIKVLKENNQTVWIFQEKTFTSVLGLLRDLEKIIS